MAEWAAFECREFYDYPRVLLVEHEGVATSLTAHSTRERTTTQASTRFAASRTHLFRAVAGRAWVLVPSRSAQSRFLGICSIARVASGSAGASSARRLRTSNGEDPVGSHSNSGTRPGEVVARVSGCLAREFPRCHRGRANSELRRSDRSDSRRRSRGSWNVINRTDDPLYEQLLSEQLSRNGLTSKGTDL